MMRARTGTRRAPCGGPMRATEPAGLLAAAVLLVVAPYPAGAAFERDIMPASADAVCGAGPAAEIIELLIGAERGTRWQLRATSSELYGLAELRSATVSLSRESPGMHLSVHASSFGGRVYREQTVQVAGARRWSEEVAIGLRGRALTLGWAGGSSELAAAVDLAAAWLVHGRLAIGLSVRNVARSAVLSSPVSSRVSGDAALVLDGVMVLASLSGEPGFAPSPAIGCELELAPWARLLAGIRMEPSSAAFGLRLGDGRTLRPDVDLAWMWHPVLGSSFSLTVSIRI